MSAVQLDSQKIEQLLNSATNERQRKMYKSLLDKALKKEQAAAEALAAETKAKTEKEAKTSTNSQKQKQKKKKTNKSKTKKEEIPIYQAIGAIVAAPYIQEDLLKIMIESQEYDLYYASGFQKKIYTSLKTEIEENGSTSMCLKVYPRSELSETSIEPKLSLALANFNSDCEKINDYPKGFILRGIWQYIPQSEYKSPVISVYRNLSQFTTFKKLKEAQQFDFCQPYHIPVIWDAPVEPFKSEPVGEKVKEMAKYFVEVRATLKNGLYVVEEMLQKPTLKLPPFITMPKQQQLEEQNKEEEN